MVRTTRNVSALRKNAELDEAKEGRSAAMKRLDPLERALLQMATEPRR